MEENVSRSWEKELDGAQNIRSAMRYRELGERERFMEVQKEGEDSKSDVWRERERGFF